MGFILYFIKVEDVKGVRVGAVPGGPRRVSVSRLMDTFFQDEEGLVYRALSDRVSVGRPDRACEDRPQKRAS